MSKGVKTLSVFLVLMVLLTFVACGKSNDKNTGNEDSKDVVKTAEESTQEPGKKVKVKLLLMSGDEARNAINEKYLTADNFKSDLADIDVEIEESIGGDDYTNKVKTYNATGELPDVFFSQGSQLLSPMIKAGSALDLLSYINGDGFADKYAIKEAISPNSDGKLYVLQAGADMFFVPRIFYHKDIFAQFDISVPKTYDEFLEVSKKLNDNNIIPWATYGLDGWAVKNYLFQNLVMAEDPQVIKDLIANKTDFSNPVCISALSKIQEMVNKGVFQPGVATTEYGAVQELFTSKKAAMYTMMSWALPELAEDPEVDFIYFPGVNPSVDMSNTLQFWGGPNSGYAVSARSDAIDAAVRVAEYCAVQEAKFFNIEQKAPTAIDTGIQLEAGSALMEKNLENFRNAATKIPTLSLHAFGGKFDPEFGLNAGKLLTGKFPPEEFVKAISDAWVENFNN